MKEVIRFWFEELKPEDWFKKSEALDQEMRERFEELYWKVVGNCFTGGLRQKGV